MNHNLSKKNKEENSKKSLVLKEKREILRKLNDLESFLKITKRQWFNFFWLKFCISLFPERYHSKINLIHQALLSLKKAHINRIQHQYKENLIRVILKIREKQKLRKLSFEFCWPPIYITLTKTCCYVLWSLIRI